MIFAAANGAPPTLWGRNAIVWLIGALIGLALARQNPARLTTAILLLTPLALLLSLWNPGQSGVHRWLSLGPLNWNVALLYLQPDASQATAFALAICLHQPLAIPFAVLAWTRPDPLLPVPEVEGIIALAHSQSHLRSTIAIAVLSATAKPAMLP